MFSASEDPSKADMSQLCKGFLVNENDIIGACGVTFKEHCEKRIYPEEDKIFELCPKPIDEIVIGGFHLWDCVDKTAKWAYNQGINVSIDEDLTELFFYSIRGPGGLPVAKIPISKEKSLKIKRRQLREGGGFFLEHARQARKDRPWMAQV